MPSPYTTVLNQLCAISQVETAQGLTIRVINNVSKRMEAKPRFHEAFQKEGCPDAFPYRQKVLNTALHRPLQQTSLKLAFVGGGGRGEGETKVWL